MSEKPIPEISEAARPYWEAAQREELYLQRNKNTGKFFFYARPWAVDDYSTDLEWVAASGKGTVATFTIACFPLFESYAGSNCGTLNPSFRSSKVTFTAIPTRTSSGLQFTMFVIIVGPSSSLITATTYGKSPA